METCVYMCDLSLGIALGLDLESASGVRGCHSCSGPSGMYLSCPVISRALWSLGAHRNSSGSDVRQGELPVYSSCLPGLPGLPTCPSIALTKCDVCQAGPNITLCPRD